MIQHDTLACPAKYGWPKTALSTGSLIGFRSTCVPCLYSFFCFRGFFLYFCLHAKVCCSTAENVRLCLHAKHERITIAMLKFCWKGNSAATLCAWCLHVSQELQNLQISIWKGYEGHGLDKSGQPKSRRKISKDCCPKHHWHSLAVLSDMPLKERGKQKMCVQHHGLLHKYCKKMSKVPHLQMPGVLPPICKVKRLRIREVYASFLQGAGQPNAMKPFERLSTTLYIKQCRGNILQSRLRSAVSQKLQSIQCKRYVYFSMPITCPEPIDPYFGDHPPFDEANLFLHE